MAKRDTGSACMGRPGSAQKDGTQWACAAPMLDHVRGADGRWAQEDAVEGGGPEPHDAAHEGDGPAPLEEADRLEPHTAVEPHTAAHTRPPPARCVAFLVPCSAW